jgi:hypothetical protein
MSKRMRSLNQGSGPLDIQADPAQLRRIAALLTGVRNGLAKVVTRAINRTATSARSRAVKALAKATGRKQKDLRQDVRLLRASWTKWRARLFFDSKGVPLIELDPRQTAAGVSTTGKGGRTLLRHGFIATMPSGHRGVFVREPKGGGTVRQRDERRALRFIGDLAEMPLVGRLPIWEPQDRSTALTADQTGVLRDVELFSAQELEKQIDSQLRGVLAQQAAGLRRGA